MGINEESEEIVGGSGNIFEDLGYPNPEEAKAKSDLAIQIHKIIKNRKLTQEKAAEIMGIDQPKVSDIVRGKLSKYTIDRLLRFLRLLGADVEIRLEKHRNRKKSTGLKVVGIEKEKNNPKRASA